jgi:hypothetical protein
MDCTSCTHSAELDVGGLSWNYIDALLVYRQWRPVRKDPDPNSSFSYPIGLFSVLPFINPKSHRQP